MPYATTTYSALRTDLAARLGDPNKTFWTDTELGIWLKEALRMFGLCSAFWRSRGTFNTSSGTAFYELPTNLLDSLSAAILSYTVTDRDIIQQLQYALLEDATDQTSWIGTEMFTYDDLADAITNRRNQFLADTGIVVTRSTSAVAPPPDGRQALAEAIIDVRRVAWVGASPVDYYVTLWRDDERLLTAGDQEWSVTPNTPEAYSVMAPPPLELQLAPIPASSGTIELLTVEASPSLDPANAATALGLPDDLTPAIKWGALADLLGIDGIARDPVRAAFAESRYQLYVKLARMLPVIIHSEISGVPLIPCTVQELDSSTPDWENSSDAPADIAIAAANLIALNPVPDDSYSITLDVVRKAQIPTADGDFIQIGREQLDMVLDYAEHLAMFKAAGAEWHATDRQASNFIAQSLTYNQRISAAARTALISSMQSQDQKRGVPRRDEVGMGIGALKGNG